MELCRRKRASFKKKALLQLYKASNKRRTKRRLASKHLLAKEDADVEEFRVWCDKMGITLNKKVRISYIYNIYNIIYINI